MDRLLVVWLLVASACAQSAQQPHGPTAADLERQREADIANERARMAQADKEESDAEARRQARRDARELSAKREAFTRRQAANEKAIADATPCVTKSTETDAERARWEGAHWVEEHCGTVQPKAEVSCDPVCVRVLPCATYSCPKGTNEEWVDLANQKMCGGVREGRRAMLVSDAPCATPSHPLLPSYGNIGE